MLKVSQIVEGCSQESRITKDLRIKVIDEPGFFGGLFGFKARTFVYQGSSTVWHQLPNGERAPTWLASFLSDTYTAYWMKNKSMQTK